MDPIKVILVDDNQDSLEIMKYYLGENSNFQLIGLCENGEELIDEVIQKKPDLIITDINMPKKNGMQAIKECMQIYPKLKFIFVTGYDEYAIEAFELAAVDYIVKPVEKVRFFQALEKVKDQMDLEQVEYTNHPLEQKMKMFSIKDLNSTRFISQADIFFVEKVGKKSLVYTNTGVYETNQTLGNIIKQLDQNFFQSHRSFIINLQKIYRITPQNETFMVSFKEFDQCAGISKLKINEVKERMFMLQEN